MVLSMHVGQKLRSNRKDLRIRLIYNCSEWLERSCRKAEEVHSQLSIPKDEGEDQLRTETSEISLRWSLSEVDRGPQPRIYL